MTDTANITTAIILSGGEGSRLNGVDKGLLAYRENTLIEHVIARMTPQVDSLVVCANRNIERYESLGLIVCKDQQHGYQGPMAGISAALNKYLLDSPATQALVSTCDAPNIPLDLRQRLQRDLDSTADAILAVAHDGDRRQNLHCLIKREAWLSLINFFNDGGRAMHRWYQQHSLIEVDFSECPRSFANLNTEHQLKNL